MKISWNVINDIFDNVGETPPEIGGILGASNEIVDHVVIDCGIDNHILCSYTPNVILLNQTISKWQDEQIEFKGVFHSHHFGVSSLSQGDKKYINTIMEAIPEQIESLYFPIAVMPNKELIAYKALRRDKEVFILKEEIQII